MDYFLIFAVSWWLVLLIALPAFGRYSPDSASVGEAKKKIVLSILTASFVSISLVGVAYVAKSRGATLDSLLGTKEFKWEDVKTH